MAAYQKNYRKKSLFNKKPKKTIYRKKASVAKVANRALTLAKANYKRTFGQMQLNQQTANSAVLPLTNTPVAILLESPFQNSPIWQVVSGQTQPAQIVRNFQTFSINDGGMAPPTNMWAGANDDTIQGRYHLAWSKYKLHFAAYPNNSTKRINALVRIDIVCQGRYTPPTSNLNQTLPYCLNQFSQLNFDNQINPMIFKTLKTYRFSYDNTQRTQDLIREIFVRHNKAVNPTYDNNSQPWTGIPVKQQTWMIIQTSQHPSTSTDDAINLQLSRVVKWRDGAGHST